MIYIEIVTIEIDRKNGFFHETIFSIVVCSLPGRVTSGQLKIMENYALLV